jgi:hypothetical protein
MTITLELKPEVEERVLAQAQAQGVSPETYLATVIEAQVLPVAPALATLEEFAVALEAFAEDSDDLPVLPPEELTREAIYRDHD